MIETSSKYLIIDIPEDVLTSSRYLSSTSLRVDIEALRIINEILSRPLISINKSDLRTISNLLSQQPTAFWNILTFLEKVHEFMGRIGLRMYEHFLVEISRWTDEEVEGWDYLQIKVTLLGSGMSELLRRGIDKFTLLKSLISMASQILPPQLRREVAILVE